ncbi:MAG TPA: hypothetical protein VGI51_04075 [Steroidobacteraceae bacterium]
MAAELVRSRGINQYSRPAKLLAIFRNITFITEKFVPFIPKLHDSATEVESRQPTSGWPGHFPVTYAALLPLLTRASAGQMGFSRVERLLCVACEFWAAVNAGELEAHLDSNVSDRLRDARFAFSEIGAEHVVNALHQTAIAIAAMRSTGERRRRIADIQERLLRVPDPVDGLIARFAWRYLSEQQHKAEPAAAVCERHCSYG